MSNTTILDSNSLGQIENGTKYARIVLRNDTELNWNAAQHLVLAKGEPAVEFAVNGAARLKIGDGATEWKDLPYISNAIEQEAIGTDLTWGKLARNISEEHGTTTEGLGLNILGYGDAPDIAAINVNTNILEEHIVELEDTTTLLNSAVNELVEQSQTHVQQVGLLDERIDETSSALNQINEAVDAAFDGLQSRTSMVEDSIDRVDYLIGELSNAQPVDVPVEILDMRIDTDGNTYLTAGGHVRAIEYKIKDLADNMSDYIDVKIPDGFIYEDNKLYLAAQGEAISEPVEIVGGTGGGGTGYGGSYTVTITNLMSSRIFSVTSDDSVILNYKYSSVDEDGYTDGAGVGLITVNGVRKNSFSVPQGDNSIDATPYLTVGENIISIKVTNSEGASRILSYTVNVAALSLTTTFPSMGLYTGPVAFQYRVTGIGNKKAFFYLDERKVGEETITANDVTRTFNIGAQPDGAHFLRAFVESTADGVTVRSNVLNIGLMWHSAQTTTPIIMVNYNGEEKIQGEVLAIPYLVYDPYHEVASIHYNIYNEDGTLYLSTSGQVDDTGKLWETQDYPAGQVKFEITCDEQAGAAIVSVAPSTFSRTVIDDGLVLEFTAQNRSNYEANPGQWSYGPCAATFENFGWAGTDGWLTDERGHAVLRFLPGGTMYIPFEPFAQDVRASGYTIEVELATHNVRDYDTTILTSYESGRGIVINSQNASLSSEQSGVTVQFKEDSRVRLTFVISQQGGRQLIYIYVNAILCSVTPYLSGDNFKQSNPVGITIGAEDCGLDLYSMRFYQRTFSALEQLNNHICDRSTVAERLEADRRNDVLDSENSENPDSILLSFDKVKQLVPVMIMECPQLPQFKGDKKKNMRVEYIDQLHPEYSFAAEGVEFDVQGTSSAVYPVKNFKVKIKSGLTYTASGETDSGWLFDKEKSIKTKTFCLKADYASSEHSNNVCLVDFYNTTNPYKTPAQIVEPKVRQGINGRPIMLFWRNTETGELICQGCYDMNDDKSNEKTFGFVDVDVTSVIPEPRIECWEWCNNNNELCLFQGTSAFDEIKLDNDGIEYPAWHDDIEPRFPDLDDHWYGDWEGELDGIRALIEWVVSTDAAKAAGNELAAPTQYPHYRNGMTTTFTIDNADYRLSKFKAEFTNYFIKDAALFYYLFTEVFLMIDSRAKNMFLTTFDGQHYFPIPYDMDTANGINNEGQLVFDYNLEDTDIVNGSKIYNGQDSVLWINIRECFPAELRAMYQELRSNDNNPFSFDAYTERVNSHQNVWPEMCWNYDAQFKYLDWHDRGQSYLEMLQGNKDSQRNWWLFNAFKYRDSKYHAGDAAKKFIILRTYTNGSITITPYSHIYARVQFGNAKDTTLRAYRNEPVTFTTDDILTLNDLETHIYSPECIADIGDLSEFRVGLCDVSQANKLQRLILGRNEEGYVNGNLKSLSVGNNELLKEVNVANCINLGTEATKALDFSGCPCLEILDATNTKITSAQFSNGGRLKTVYLPDTITALIIRNQKNLTNLNIAGYNSLSTIALEGICGIDVESLIANSPHLDRIRLVGTTWTATDEASLMQTIDKLSHCDGLSADGSTTLINAPVVTGRVHIQEISNEALQTINDIFPELVVVVDGVAKFFIRYNDWNNTLLYRYIANEGEDAIDPIVAGHIEQPVRPDTDNTTSTWRGWSELPENVQKPWNIVAKYNNTYKVLFLDDEDNIINTQWIADGQAAMEPISSNCCAAPTRNSTVQYNYAWYGWDRDYTKISAPCDFKPLFNATVRDYEVRFYNDLEVLQISHVPYGLHASFTGDINTITKKIGGEVSPYYEFIGWDRDPAQVIIEGPTDFSAEFFFDGYIEDSWAQIALAAASGDTSTYGVGGRKIFEYETGEGLSTVEAEIVGTHHDTLVEQDTNYNGNAQKATFTFILRNLGADKRMFNTQSKNPDGTTEYSPEQTYNGGGWEHSDVRAWMQTALFSALPADLQQAIKPVVKESDGGFYKKELIYTNDNIWLPSTIELGLQMGGNSLLDQEGAQYPVYIDKTSRRKVCFNDKNFAMYWTRSTNQQGNHSVQYIDSRGDLGSTSGASRAGIAIGFCI